MSRTQGFITLNLSGLRTFNLGLPSAPTWANFIVTERSTGETVAHISIGKTLGPTKQHCMSTFADSSGQDSFRSNTHVVRHYERIGGVITLILSASFDSFTASGIRLNVDVANANYQVLVEAGD